MFQTGYNRLLKSATTEERHSQIVSQAPTLKYGEIAVSDGMRPGLGLKTEFLGYLFMQRKKGVGFLTCPVIKIPNANIATSGIAVWNRGRSILNDGGDAYTDGIFSAQFFFPGEKEREMYREIINKVLGFKVLTGAQDVQRWYGYNESLGSFSEGLWNMKQPMQQAFDEFERVVEMLWMVGGFSESRYQSAMRDAITYLDLLQISAVIKNIGSANCPVLPEPIEGQEGTYLGNVKVLDSLIPLDGNLKLHVPNQIVRPVIRIGENSVDFVGSPNITLDLIVNSSHQDAEAADLLITSGLKLDFTQKGIPFTMSEERRSGLFTIPAEYVSSLPEIVQQIITSEEETPRMQLIKQALSAEEPADALTSSLEGNDLEVTER